MRWLLPLLFCTATAFGQVQSPSMGWVDSREFVYADYLIGNVADYGLAAYPIRKSGGTNTMFVSGVMYTPLQGGGVNGAILSGSPFVSIYSNATNFTVIASAKVTTTGHQCHIADRGGFNIIFEYNNNLNLNAAGAGITITSNIWYRVAATFTGSTHATRFFTNGVFVATSTAGTMTTASSTNVDLGFVEGFTAYQLLGYNGGARLIGRVLTDAEVKDEYNLWKANHPNLP